jgi:DNA-binding GntR family transcriptional regulator
LNYPLVTIDRHYLGSSVYATLRNMLICGGFTPDEPLRIRQLAAQLGTSVTPVRDAILQLAKEQALVLRTARDIRVPALDRSQYQELHLLRMELFGLAAGEAAKHGDSSYQQQLDATLQQICQAQSQQDLSRFLHHHHLFYLQLAEVSNTPLLHHFIDSLLMRCGPLLAEAWRGQLHSFSAEHHQVLQQTLARQDSEGARQAARQCVFSENQRIINYLHTQQQATPALHSAS